MDPVPSSTASGAGPSVPVSGSGPASAPAPGSFKLKLKLSAQPPSSSLPVPAPFPAASSSSLVAASASASVPSSVPVAAPHPQDPASDGAAAGATDHDSLARSAGAGSPERQLLPPHQAMPPPPVPSAYRVQQRPPSVPRPGRSDASADASSSLYAKEAELRARIEAHAAHTKELKGVSAAKYRALKRKYDDVVEKNDSTSFALFRTQKQLLRLREEKAALLDRILLLESAAGFTSADVTAAEEQFVSSERAREFPLLHPPPLPSLEDRPPAMPVLTTATELHDSSYNAPLEPPLPPLSVAPRFRSRHYASSLAAQKLRDDAAARRAAQGLPKATFPAVAALGLEGSTVALHVEKILTGEEVVQDIPALATATATNKRRRDSSHTTVRAKAREAPGSSVSAALHSLPNPFAFSPVAAPPHAAPASSSLVTPSTAAESPATAGRTASVEAYDSPTSTMSYDDDDVKPAFAGAAGASTNTSGGPKRPRKSDGLKPKRVKQHGITSGTFIIQHVQRNPDGTPKLPLTVGIMIIKSLGRINPKEHFCTERYIFPVGYEASRKYPSMIDPTETVEYNCRIVDGGNDAPRFELEPADQPGVVIAAGTPTGAWSQVVRAANKIRERNHSNSVSGPDYYGLAHNVVKALIQELPGATEMPSYIMQNFVEEPDPALMTAEELKAKKANVGPKKVVGVRRRTLADDGDIDMVDGASFSEAGGPTSVQGVPAAPLASTAANPYAIPSSSAFNPYALPLSSSAPSSGEDSGSFNPYNIPAP